MPGSKEPQTRIPFGPFEADLLTQELRKHGIRLPLPRQSFQILKMLLERRGELVTRDELRAALWPSDTFVHFEHGLNSAVNKLRDAFGLAFSPDGRRIAYVRGDNPDATHWRIFTASLDGYDETLLYTGDSSDWPVSWAWSPKGDGIFYSVGGAINVLDVRTGKSHRFVSFKDKFVAAIRWSPDGRVLFANYRGASAKDSSGQIGFVQPTGRDIEPITRDANTYGGLALSEDGRTLTTIQSRSYATISVLSKVGQQFVEPRLLLSQASEFDEGSGLSWTADGNLLVSDTVRLLKLGADGKNRAQLLADSSAVIFDASPCGANYLVLSWASHGGPFGIWRVNADGSNPLRLTNGTDGDSHRLPVCSPDEKWVYYVDWSENISRVPLDGSGKPQVILRLPQNYDFAMAQSIGGLSISSEGKTLADAVFDASQRQIKIALFEPGSSSPPRILGTSRFWSSDLRFTSDGRSVAYVIREKGVDNLWVQPLNGSAGHAITDFKSEQIWSFSLSPDGKGLAVLRGHYDSDVVLLQESNSARYVLPDNFVLEPTCRISAVIREWVTFECAASWQIPSKGELLAEMEKKRGIATQRRTARAYWRFRKSSPQEGLWGMRCITADSRWSSCKRPRSRRKTAPGSGPSKTCACPWSWDPRAAPNWCSP